MPYHIAAGQCFVCTLPLFSTLTLEERRAAQWVGREEAGVEEEGAGSPHSPGVPGLQGASLGGRERCAVSCARWRCHYCSSTREVTWLL